MNKKRPTRKKKIVKVVEKPQKKTVKVVEKPGSSRDLTPNPYSDDGEYGSDSNYDPHDDNISSSSTLSDFVVRPKRKRKRNESGTQNTLSEADLTDKSSDSETESVIEDTEDGLSSSSESIFDLRVTHRPERNIPTTSLRCKYQSILPLTKKPKLNLSCSTAARQPSPYGSINSRDDTDGDTLSVSSEVLKKLEDEFTLENVSLSLNHTEIESYTKHKQQASSTSFPPPQPEETEAKMGSALTLPRPPHRDNMDPNSGSPQLPPLHPDEMEANLGAPPIPPPHLEQIEDNPGAPPKLPPHPEQMEANLGGPPIPPPHPEEIEANPVAPPIPPPHPEQMEANSDAPPIPPPHPEQMEANPGAPPIPLPHPEDMEANPGGSPTPPPHLEGMEANPDSPPPEHLKSMEAVSSSPPPYHEEMEANPHSSSPQEFESPSRRQQSSTGNHLAPFLLNIPLILTPALLSSEALSVDSGSYAHPSPHREETLLNSGNPPHPLILPSVEANSSLRPSPPGRYASPRLQPPSSAEENRPLPSPELENVQVSPIEHASRSRTRDSDLSARRRLRRLQSSPRPAIWETTSSDIPIFDFDEGSAGIQFEVGRNASALEVFNELLSPNIVDFIIAKTNDYGKKLCNSDRPSTRTNRKYSYKDLDKEELFKFFGLCFLMGQINTPQKRKLFTFTDTLYFHPIFQHVMSARRFEQILRCLCVSELNAKKKDKIVNFIDAVTENFRKCYKPNKELSLDESLLLFRGRLSFRQYIKSKKARYGIKFYELASSDGYMLNILMYTGKDDEDPTEHGRKTEKIVMRLMKPFLMKGHWLFMDNYYNSVTLSEKLLGLQTHTAGTLRTNRKCNPKDLVKRKLKKNEHFWVRKNKVYVSKWLDKRPILMVTTLNQPKLVEVSNRHGQRRMKPEEISIYNKHMAGIDRSDQMISYYSSPRKSLRWYKKVIFHLLDLTVWNSFFLHKKYCKSNSKRCEFLQFREDLIRQLLNLSPGLKPASLMNRSRYDNRQHEPGEFVLPINTGSFGHWPEKIPVKINSKKSSTYMKCKMCTKKKIRRETSLRCMACEDKPALCAVCFQEWHSQ